MLFWLKVPSKLVDNACHYYERAMQYSDVNNTALMEHILSSMSTSILFLLRKVIGNSRMDGLVKCPVSTEKLYWDNK